MRRPQRYYVRDLVRILGITRRTLSNWENAGKIPQPKRDPMNRYRWYSEADLRKLRKITQR